MGNNGWLHNAGMSRWGSRFLCAAVLWTLLVTFSRTRQENAFKSRVPLAAPDDVNCVPPGIDAFPPDFLTQDQRGRGGVAIHIAIVCYLCAMTAVVCDKYFVPALETIVDKLQLSPDVAGATFMAMGASAPELFSSIAGSFITEDDIGLGTILGSAVFNILGISGIVGIVLGNKSLSIQRYPVIRDCIVYGLTVLVLGYVLSDNIVEWWEAFTLLMIFSSYIILMHYNGVVERGVRKLVRVFRNKSPDSEKKPLLESQGKVPEIVVVQSSAEQKQSEPDGDSAGLCVSAFRLLMWLPSILFRLTIPPVRFYPATFIASIVWMGALSYVTVWMVTIIGYTFSIPDAVSGLTLLAAGSSVPDLIATVLITRSGEGNMAISNLLGSNTFDLAFCLGAPWLLKTLTSGRGRLLVYSSAMVYTTITLLLNLLALLLIFQLTGWRLNRTSGIICLGLYFLCITLACLYELNVFGEINLPTCS